VKNDDEKAEKDKEDEAFEDPNSSFDNDASDVEKNSTHDSTTNIQLKAVSETLHTLVGTVGSLVGTVQSLQSLQVDLVDLKEKKKKANSVKNDSASGLKTANTGSERAMTTLVPTEDAQNAASHTKETETKKVLGHNGFTRKLKLWKYAPEDE